MNQFNYEDLQKEYEPPSMAMEDFLYVSDFPSPVRVIFDNPVTVVYFSDGSKQVVKLMNGDTFNEEIGLAMALSKKLLKGNGSEFHRLLEGAQRRPPRELRNGKKKKD